MKLKNVKVGVRVQYKGSGSRPERRGALGTLAEGGLHTDIPFVCWDDDIHNRTTYEGQRVSPTHINDLRKVK